MKLTTKRPTQTWTFDEGETLTFRLCESLDENLAQDLAAKWYKELLTGQSVQADFGLSETGLGEFLEEIGDSVDDTRSYADYLFNVALMMRLVSEAKNWTLDDKPIEKGRRLFAHILRDPNIKRDWTQRAYGPLHKAKLAGNA